MAMGMQKVELLFDERPSVDRGSIRDRVQSLVSPGSELTKSGQVHFFHNDYMVEFQDGTMPAQTVLMEGARGGEQEQYDDCIQQSWSCPDARDLVSDYKACFLLTEFVSAALSSMDRLHLFHGVLQAILEQTSPKALVFHHSSQVISPDSYRQDFGLEPAQRSGTVNVRFYNTENQSPGDMIMDTRGLDEIGLPDLQCHFRSLDPDTVARLLMNLALYEIENGAVIESGHTVQGASEGDRWACQYESSLLKPDRQVLDVNPGPPHAAGTRR